MLIKTSEDLNSTIIRRVFKYSYTNNFYNSFCNKFIFVSKNQLFSTQNLDICPSKTLYKYSYKFYNIKYSISL